jgi:hypothetical protein
MLCRTIFPCIDITCRDPRCVRVYYLRRPAPSSVTTATNLFLSWPYINTAHLMLRRLTVGETLLRSKIVSTPRSQLRRFNERSTCAVWNLRTHFLHYFPFVDVAASNANYDFFIFIAIFLSVFLFCISYVNTSY